MKTPRFASLLPAMLAVLTLFAHAADPAEPDTSKEIPPALKDWESWATWNDEHRLCPTPYSDAAKHLCFWPSRLELHMEQGGGKFDLSVEVFHETWVPLPGSQELWPVEVKSNGGTQTVVEHAGAPSVHLERGHYRLEGAYRWKQIPQRVAVPPQIGVLALVLDGQPVEAPAWDAGGFVWLKRDSATEEADQNYLGVKLYAALDDGLPLWLHTQVELTVAGKSREEDLGTVLPEGWKLAGVDSPLPTAIDAAGRAKAQVRAGKWTISVDAFRFDRATEFHFAQGVKPAAPEELIAFRAKPEFRTMQVTGAPPIDVSQTTFPEQWHGLPVYRWDTATPWRLEERLRGMGEQKPAGLTIQRELWLDEGGSAFTFRDHLSGAMQQTWRLDAAEGEALGSVRSGGQGQLITRHPATGAAGVEIRTRNLNLEATGRLPRTAAMAATGWRSDADSLRGTLNLPPGWRLFALFGVDWVQGDWLTAWTLLDLFLLLIFTLAVRKLWGAGAAVVAFLGFGLSFHEPLAPRYLWLIILIPLALQRVVPAGWGRRLVMTGKWIALACFALVFVTFIARQVQQAIYPQLEATGSELESDLFGGLVYTSTKTLAPDDYTRGLPGLEAVPGAPAVSEVASPELNVTQHLQRKLDTIIIPKLEFRDALVSEAIDFIRQKSVELDETERDPSQKGINIVMRLDPQGLEERTPSEAKPPAGVQPPSEPVSAGVIPGLEAVPGAAGLNEPRITITLTNVPLGEALRYVTNIANLKYLVDEHAVLVVPKSFGNDTLVTRQWKFPKDYFVATNGISLATEPRDFLAAQLGMTFPPGSSAMYLPGTSTLVVRNTAESLDIVDNLIEQAPKLGATGAGGDKKRDSTLKPAAGNEFVPYDPEARIQTGPGVPEWKWREITFGWNGPVSVTQQVRPWLISVTLERVLTALRVALLLALAAVMLGNRRLTLPRFRRAPKAAALLAFLACSACAWAQAPIPDSSTLEKLRERLLEVPDAFPTAADIPTATLTLQDRKLTMDVEVHAALRVAVPLPGKLPTWSPLTVLVDEKPETALRREDGFLWVLVEPGVHHVRVEGSLANVSEWQWTFQLRSHTVKIDAPDWTVTGVKPTGVPEAQVFFVRKQKAEPGLVTYERQEVEAIAEVDRTLELGLIWQVKTSVRRLSPAGRAIALRVPLIKGESVLSPAVVKEGFVEVRIGAQEQAFSWESSLAAAPALALGTHAEDAWVEHWHLVASPVWNITLGGLTPVFEPGTATLDPVWQPWPGESITLAISRPEALAGPTLTVHRAMHDVSLGLRQRTAKLDLNLDCSVGQDFLLALPGEAEVTGLQLNGSTIPVRKADGRLIIPVRPGAQSVSVSWKTAAELSALARVDEVRLPVESANLWTVINVPDDRWVLWVDGPLRGPAVRFWGILVCSLLAAMVLSRLAHSALPARDWMLLALGLTQVPLPAAFVVVAWLFFLAWRGSESFQQRGRFSYNFLQLALILLTAAALGVLVFAVSEGLLGRPEMFIVGADSTRETLRWYLDRSGLTLPRPGCVSISIWWYRFAMLAWALWLAAALLRWLGRGWQAFSRGGFFRRKAKAPPVPVSPVAPPPFVEPTGGA